MWNITSIVLEWVYNQLNINIWNILNFEYLSDLLVMLVFINRGFQKFSVILNFLLAVFLI
jgi:hypothetical protein